MRIQLLHHRTQIGAPVLDERDESRHGEALAFQGALDQAVRIHGRAG